MNQPNAQEPESQTIEQAPDVEVHYNGMFPKQVAVRQALLAAAAFGTLNAIAAPKILGPPGEEIGTLRALYGVFTTLAWIPVVPILSAYLIDKLPVPKISESSEETLPGTPVD